MATDISFWVNGVDKSAMYLQGSLQVRQINNQRWTASCSIRALILADIPDVGVHIQFKEDGNPLFVGSLDSWEYERYINKYGQTDVKVDLVLIDLTARLDQIIADIPVTYAAGTAGAAVKSLMDDFAPFEFITYDLVGSGGYIHDGITLTIDTLVTADHQSLLALFQGLAQLCGFILYTDAAGNLHFEAPGDTTAPFSFTEVSNNFTKLRYKKTREDYFNEAFYAIAYEWQPVTTTSFAGDGVTQTWDLPGFAGLVKAMRVDATEVSIGTVGEGNAYQWEYGSSAIVQDPGQTVLTSMQTLYVDWYELGSNYIFASDGGAISDRSTVEGNSGKYMAVVSNSSESNGDRATAFVTALVAGGSVMSKLPQIVCNGFQGSNGVQAVYPRAGMSVTITHATMGVSANFLIQEVSGQHLAGQGMQYTLTFINGYKKPNSTDFFQALAGGAGGASGGASGGGASIGGGVIVLDIALTANYNVSPYPAVIGALLIINITVDATGGYSFDWGPDFEGNVMPEIDTSANLTHRVACVARGGKWVLATPPVLAISPT